MKLSLVDAVGHVGLPAQIFLRASASDVVVIVGTTRYLDKYKKNDAPELKTGVVVAEVELVNQRLTGNDATKRTILPVLLDGSKEESLPPLARGSVYADFRKETHYFVSLGSCSSNSRMTPSAPAWPPTTWEICWLSPEA